MREIKFRAWDKKDKTMLFFNGIFNSRPFLERSTFPQYESYPEYHELEIMQFTGLKDKNGNEIFEGDIVKRIDIDWNKVTKDDIRNDDITLEDYPQKEFMRDVVTMERFPLYWLKNEGFGYEGEDLESIDKCEVIGNVYENPELVKE